MLHRTTWVAIPVLGLVLVGSGLGWWGYGQYRERQALAIETENQYENSFHNLATEVDQLQRELGKTIVSGDANRFQDHLRDVWRITYAAQTDASRLPFELMPMHQTQQFLSQVANSTNTWIEQQAKPTNASVRKQLQTYYAQAGKLNGQLRDLQATVLNNHLSWQDVNRALRTHRTDNQVVDGFRKMDTQAGTFVESQQRVPSPVRPDTDVLSKEPVVDAEGAKRAVRAFLGLPASTDLQVQAAKAGAPAPVYSVSGAVPAGSLTATVSQHGGHVLSMSITPKPTKGEVDFSEAEDKAAAWLTAHGFGHVENTTARQYDGTAYYVFVPVRDGAQVVTQGIMVKTDLHSGNVIGYDGTNYFMHPVQGLAPRRLNANQLRKVLSPDLHVQMQRDVILEDPDKHWVPAVAFYGTSNDETYVVYVNANTGKEIEVEQLS
ncbi:PepSY1/2 domain-containing protein [Alicyclobacillus macrosporangiidus]|uniref:PepSY1/2 domain-containing protein n=1 Tax=Alicyclobacillus macrosporangiidus TaxID=392015 RepID=UPI000496EEA9|nr:PepSY1/2 domain-containing protein [Alicyclobacillus macrosporangiidus]